MNNHQSRGSLRLLGKKLKELRNRANETLAEAAGAVEIDVKELARYELGQTRPGPEILLLLVSHFGAGDDEALKLWEMAGYSMERIPQARMGNNEPIVQEDKKKTEKRILFTDIVDVVVNKYGVVMNFMQTGGSNTPPAPVARVGMSREHAKSVLQILQITLTQTEQNTPELPKRLITPDNPSSDNSS